MTEEAGPRLLSQHVLATSAQWIVIRFSTDSVFQFASLREFSAFQFLIMDVYRLGLQNIFAELPNYFKLLHSIF